MGCSCCIHQGRIPGFWGWNGGPPDESFCAVIERGSGDEVDQAQAYRSGEADTCPMFDTVDEGDSE